MRSLRFARWLSIVAATTFLIAACVTSGRDVVRQHLWWSGIGPVLPHDTFPGDCKLCHVGNDWQTLKSDFAFDHEKETGVPLIGAHAQALCLRCHNDRGDVEHFRPKSAVLDDPLHGGYWWLAYDFQNYLLSCSLCNRVRKKTRFFTAIKAA